MNKIKSKYPSIAKMLSSEQFCLQITSETDEGGEAEYPKAWIAMIVTLNGDWLSKELQDGSYLTLRGESDHDGDIEDALQELDSLCVRWEGIK